mmetsp:Transcript_96013/g.170397  ORF Transcript_96013/g.170397 Transcript_96013/m.170397 type:complete len:81 (+) Transcript_96013:295-537(+)
MAKPYIVFHSLAPAYEGQSAYATYISSTEISNQFALSCSSRKAASPGLEVSKCPTGKALAEESLSSQLRLPSMLAFSCPG